VKGFETGVMEGRTYATEEMVLEVELEVCVLLDSAKDLKSIVRKSRLYMSSVARTFTPSAVTFS
jgi:hypothetical protein